MAIKIYLKKLHEDAILPCYATPGSAGADLFSLEKVEVPSNTRILIGTGIAIELPDNYEAQIRSRSGLALNFGVVVLNSPGTIDSDYRGEIKIILMNHSQNTFTIEKNMRVAQMIIAPVVRGEFIENKDLKKTVRHDLGFGSTGLL